MGTFDGVALSLKNSQEQRGWPVEENYDLGCKSRVLGVHFMR
jgi:hypothetical protein